MIPWWYMTLKVVCLALLALVLCTRRILRGVVAKVSVRLKDFF